MKTDDDFIKELIEKDLEEMRKPKRENPDDYIGSVTITILKIYGAIIIGILLNILIS